MGEAWHQETATDNLVVEGK